jgi:hypothetical protein
MRVVSVPSRDATVASVRAISSQNPDTENRRAMAARPPSCNVPTTAVARALRWNNGSGVHTTSSGRRRHARAIWADRLAT